MDYIDQQTTSADGEVPVENVHADAEYENAKGKKKKNALNSVNGVWLKKPEVVKMKAYYAKLKLKGYRGNEITKRLNAAALKLLNARTKNAFGEMESADDFEEADDISDSNYENGFGKWLTKKIVRRRADGVEEVSAEGGSTIQPNKYIAIGVWGAIALGTALFALHAYQTLKTIKK